MANNRMYLVHIPTGLAVPLAKRMGWGWYMTSEDAIEELGIRVSMLFEILEKEFDYGYGKQDDFAIAMEDSEDATSAVQIKAVQEYGKYGMVQLTLKSD